MNDDISGSRGGQPSEVGPRHTVQGSSSERARTALAELDAIASSLSRRFSEERRVLSFQQYLDARIRAERYATEILPRARQTNELVQRGYRLGEIGYLDLLTAQRTYSQTNFAYLDALSALWVSWTEIDGLLLSQSLSSPPN